MAIKRRSVCVGSLASLALGTVVGCGTLGAADSDPIVPPGVVKPGMPPTPRTQPPALSGGTLLVLSDGTTAVAADADRDVIWLADLTKLTQSGRIDLQSGDEPGRLVQDSAGKVHVALRRGGSLLTIDPVAGKIISRRAACAAPRGLAYDAATDRLHLACAGGELVTFSASGGDALRTVQLDRDLRDVIVQGDHLLVSRFRSAELLTVDASGAVTGRVKPQPVRGQLAFPPAGDPMNNVPALAEPGVAWQVRPLPDGKVLMLFERATPRGRRHHPPRRLRQRALQRQRHRRRCAHHPRPERRGAARPHPAADRLRGRLRGVRRWQRNLPDQRRQRLESGQ